MRSNKKYTNTTFTKRVDHAEGRQRSAQTEPGVCKICGAVYLNRRWTNNVETNTQRWGMAELVTCPACQKEKTGIVSGYVHVKGDFLLNHVEEIKRLLRNEAERAAEDNPTARIMKWEDKGDGELTVMTTTEHLAQRLGHALEKAFNGSVRYQFSHENKLAHVWWERN